MSTTNDSKTEAETEQSQNVNSFESIMGLISFFLTRKIAIDIKLLNQESSLRCVCAASYTIDGIKEKIFNNISQSLQIEQMALVHRGKILSGETKLQDLEGQGQDEIIVLEQVKAELHMIPGLVVDREEQDAIYCEKGVALMPCGHKVCRGGMEHIIQTQLEKGKITINCPHLNSKTQAFCNYQWEIQLCKKVAVMTSEQSEKFQISLAENFIKSRCIECPKCKSKVQKGDLKTNRVVCTICKYGDFCFQCQELWRGNRDCGNSDCKFYQKKVENSPWDYQFSLYTKNGNQKNYQNYMLPRHRFCPTCKVVIEHIKWCKHITCFCKTEFCWLCLSIKQNGQWPCGQAYEYCGKIAPVQKLQKN